MKHALIGILTACAAATVGCSSEDPQNGGNGATGGSGASTGGNAGTGGGSGGSGPTGGTGGTTNSCASPAVAQATEASNYSFSSTIMLDVIPVAPDSELSVDWSGVTQDFTEVTLDPVADVNLVSLILWNLSPTELAAKMNDDELQQANVVAPIMYLPMNGETSASMFDFLSAAGTTLLEEEILQYMDAEAYPPANHTYTAMAASGTVLGKGTRMIQAFQLDPSSTNTEIVLDSESTGLTYSATLTDLQPIQVPAGSPDITIDWSGMQTNAMGREFASGRVNEALVAKYSLSPTELQAQFLQLESIHDGIWRGSIATGASVDLSTLTDDSGAAFPGIDDTSTWVVALMCGNCTNPAPWYLTILEPCAD